jgi:hypothetical protein
MQPVLGDDQDSIGAQRKNEAEIIPITAAILSDLHFPGKKTPMRPTFQLAQAK